MTAVQPLGIVPSLPLIYGLIMRLEQGERASRALDAEVFEALGWQVLRDRQMVLSPLSTSALPMPRPSRRVDHAALVVPGGWDWGAGMRNRRATAWCSIPNPDGGGLWFFESVCPVLSMPGLPAPGVPALALLRCALHAQRALLLRASDEGAPPARLPDDRWSCDCGWVGPHDAARGGACPDCRRQIHEAVA